MQKANAEIGATGNDMGTTVTAVLLDAERGRLSLVHVGDSRGYLLASGAPGIVRLTRDDTFVQALVGQGRADGGGGARSSAPVADHAGGAG